jgi:hypothetical protein
MRSAVVLAAALMGIAVAGLIVASLAISRPEAFTLGVSPSLAVKLKATTTICQGPIAVPEDSAFDGVTFQLGTERRPGPALAVTVREAASRGDALALGPELASGRLAPGYPDVDEAPKHTVWMREVPALRSIAVCLTNRGRHRVFVYGNADVASRTSSAYVGGSPVDADLALRFERRPAKAAAALVPAMLRRASLFAGWPAAPWSVGALAIIVLVAVPLLLVAAVRAATTADSEILENPPRD